MALDDVIHVVIDRQSASLTLPGFGTPMVLAPAAEVPVGFTERLRYYTDADDMLDDGFLSTAITYLMVRAILSQSPHPERVAVGRRAAPAAQVIDVTITLVVDNTNYTITAIDDGDESYGPFTYLSDGTATDVEIVAGLLALINATGVLVTATVGPGTDVLRLTADTAGIPFSVTETDANMTQATTTPSSGMAEDLLAITNEQPDWYCLLITEQDNQSIRTAAAIIEAQRRIFVAQSANAAVVATPYNLGTALGDDIASKLKVRGFARTAIAYHPVATELLAAAWVGAVLPFVAGSLTWKFKELAGVAGYSLTSTQRTNLVSKNGNGLMDFGGRNITFEGWMAVGEFIDVIHGLDRLHSRIQELIAITFLSLPKVPMTQKGIEMLAANVRTALAEASNPTVALIADSRVRNGKTEVPAFTVTPPSIADIPSGDRAARRIPASNPILFEGTLAGAIHDVNITGAVAV